jgi:hypothetical protein
MFRQHRSGTQTKGSSGVIREVAASTFHRKDISISSGMVPVFECDSPQCASRFSDQLLDPMPAVVCFCLPAESIKDGLLERFYRRA